MEQTNQLISTAEAAKFLGIKVSYLHKLMMRRVIPYYKPNGKLCFFDKAELEAWMKNVRVASQAELDQQAQKYIIQPFEAVSHGGIYDTLTSFGQKRSAAFQPYGGSTLSLPPV